jgi:sugar phosphate isomerase/epimerase
MRVAVDGIYFGVLPQRSPSDLIALTVEVGAEGLNWPYHPDYDEDDPARTAAQLRDAGLAVVSLGLTRQTSAIPDSEAAFREVFAKCVEAAGILGTTVIDCWPYRPVEVTKEAAQAVLASNLDAVVPIAQAAGCCISFEFEPDTTIERFAEAKAFLEPWAPTARLTADTYHIIRIGDDLADAGAALGDRIGMIHFSASHRGEPGTDDDQCNYAAFLGNALDNGYAGDIVLQYAPPEDAAGSLKRAISLTREVIKQCAE